MNLFRRLVGDDDASRRAQQKLLHNPADPFGGQGFVYHETVASPDGRLQVLNGSSGGEKGPTLVEPRVIEVATGRIVFDLWNTYQNYLLTFADANQAELSAHNPFNNGSRIADINFATETFALRDDAAVAYPLFQLSERISMH